MRTFPPFTKFSGLPGGSFYILSDGRCFKGDSKPHEPIIMTPTASP
jgi:hypothetical protein